MNKFQNIAQGWKNYLSQDSVGLATAMERAKICSVCPEAEKGIISQLIKDEIKEIEGMKCDECGCPLSAKTRSPNETCPLDKW